MLFTQAFCPYSLLLIPYSDKSCQLAVVRLATPMLFTQAFCLCSLFLSQIRVIRLATHMLFTRSFVLTLCSLFLSQIRVGRCQASDTYAVYTGLLSLFFAPYSFYPLLLPSTLIPLHNLLYKCSPSKRVK